MLQQKAQNYDELIKNLYIINVDFNSEEKTGRQELEELLSFYNLDKNIEEAVEDIIEDIKLGLAAI